MPGLNARPKDSTEKKELTLRWEVEKTGWDESNMVKTGN
jgi:hypothetical protein